MKKQSPLHKSMFFETTFLNQKFWKKACEKFSLSFLSLVLQGLRSWGHGTRQKYFGPDWALVFSLSLQRNSPGLGPTTSGTGHVVPMISDPVVLPVAKKLNAIFKKVPRALPENLWCWFACWRWMNCFGSLLGRFYLSFGFCKTFFTIKFFSFRW